MWGANKLSEVQAGPDDIAIFSDADFSEEEACLLLGQRNARN